MEYELTRCDDH